MVEAALSLERARGAPLTLLSDDRLARRASRGDHRAFAEIFNRYHQPLYRYCRSILHHDEDARDALQNTMTSALRGLQGSDRSISLKPWLYRIAHNESISLLRRRAGHAALDQVPEASIPAFDSDPTAERMQQLMTDLAQLTERQRGALVMRELAGLGYGEIGATFAMSEGAARQCVHEARSSLHRMAEGRGLDCERVREVISARDGRRLRAAGVRSHLQTCDGCRSFRAAIATRSADLRALAPPLAAPAAAGLLAALLGGGGGSGGAGGLLAALGIGASEGAGAVATAKGVATTAAAISLSVGTVAAVQHDLPVPVPGAGEAKHGPAKPGVKSDHDAPALASAAASRPRGTGRTPREARRKAHRRSGSPHASRGSRQSRPSRAPASHRGPVDEPVEVPASVPAVTAPAAGTTRAPAASPPAASTPAPQHTVTTSVTPEPIRQVIDTSIQTARQMVQDSMATAFGGQSSTGTKTGIVNDTLRRVQETVQQALSGSWSPTGR